MPKKNVEDHRRERFHSHEKKYAREAVTPDDDAPAELPCHRCGRPVVVTATLAKLLALGQVVVVECEGKPCEAKQC